MFQFINKDGVWRIRSLNDNGSVKVDPGLAVTSAGNVGIGTMSPGAKLEVNGNMTLSDASATLTVGNSTSQSTANPTTLNMGGTFANSVTSAKAKWKLYYDGVDIQTSGIGISLGLFNFFTYAGGSYYWYSSDTEKMSLYTTGYLQFDVTLYAHGTGDM